MKSLKEILAEARMVATGDYRISASGRKVRRLIKVGDDDYNKADDVDKDGDVDADDEKAKKMRGESAEHIEEAVSVKKQDYSWGKMVTVHHGADTSYPLHPEHQSAIKKLKDGEHTSFTDETNRKVTAHREGEHVHLTSKGTSRKTTVAHSHFNESVNKSDIPAYLRKKTGDKLTTQDLDKERTQNRSHPETLKKINGTQKESIDFDKIRADAADHLKKNIDKQSDDRIAALKNPKKPESFLAKVGRKQINMVKGAWHGLTKESADKDEDDVPFDKPYKKVENDVVTDKSGAKHGPMSRARNLARIAAAQQQKKAKKK